MTLSITHDIDTSEIAFALEGMNADKLKAFAADLAADLARDLGEDHFKAFVQGVVDQAEQQAAR
jgi:hypothetical protein